VALKTAVSPKLRVKSQAATASPEPTAPSSTTLSARAAEAVQRAPRPFSEIPALVHGEAGRGLERFELGKPPMGVLCRRWRNAKYSRRGLAPFRHSRATLARLGRSRGASQCQSHARCRRSRLNALPDADSVSLALY